MGGSHKNFKNSLSEIIVLSKLDAALQQLETAIELFFNDGHKVSFHTLVAAAHGILHDLGKKKGIRSSLKDSIAIRSEYLKEWKDAINSPQNYFKHADKDDGKELEFHFNFTQFYLIDAIVIYQKLAGQMPFKLAIYFSWFCLQYPKIISDKWAKEKTKKFNKKIGLNPKAVAKEALKEFAQIPGVGENKLKRYGAAFLEVLRKA